MNKPNQNTRNKIHSLWLVLVVICIVITYYYMKTKATNNYKTILQIASKNCNLEIVEFLVKNLLDINTQIPKVTALHYASGSGCLEIAKFLVEKGADISASEYERWTALHSAALKGNLEIVKFLLVNGADPNIRDRDGKNPRDVAVIELRHNKDKNKPYREIIKLLAAAEDTFDGKK